MQIRSVRDSNIDEVNQRAGAFLAACGYERRSGSISRHISIAGPKVAICFEEWPSALARKANERAFRSQGFALPQLSGNDSLGVQNIVGRLADEAFATGKSLAFDISSMTRAWHGGIVRQLWTMPSDKTVEVQFCYIPAKFRRPAARSTPNQFVAPVRGFASLATPERPVAAIIGLGYEKERALGMQQLLDPETTMLLVPKTGDRDLFYPEVVRSNRGIMSRTPKESIFPYSPDEPAATLAILASIIAGLRENYRVVLVSLGPKILGLLCFLLATRFPDVSVWRVSSGIYGRPRDAEGDQSRLVVMSTTWGPDSDSWKSPGSISAIPPL